MEEIEMYFKKIKIHKPDYEFNIDYFIQILQESSYFINIEKTEEQLIGADQENGFFKINYIDYSIVFLELEIEASKSSIIDVITWIIKEKELKFEATKTEDQFTLLKDIKGDIHTIKYIMIFYLILTILGFFLSLMK